MPKTKSVKKKYEKALREPKNRKFVLRLYVAGMTVHSTRAIKNIRDICDNDLRGKCDLEVIDIYQHQTLAAGEQIVATPTLIKKLPAPLKKFIGDLGDKERILLGLDIVVKK